MSEHTNTLRISYWQAAALAVVVVPLGVLALQAALVERLVSSAEKNLSAETFNPKVAMREYERALWLKPSHEQSLYDLARLEGIYGNRERALLLISSYKEARPDDARALYVEGLTHGFMGNHRAAEEAFRAYIEQAPAPQWQSRLDLAWALFEQGNIETAHAVLREATAQFGENAWLNTSLGATLVALGRHGEAVEVLARAAKFAEELSPEEWERNYVFNDPARTEESMRELREVIALNQSLARKEALPTGGVVARAVASPFVGISPKGLTHGVVVAACGETQCTDVACTSRANACGQTTSGTLNTCIGVCSAVAPANPAGLGTACTATNSCGVSGPGTIQCTGQCGPVPPLPATYSTACTVATSCGNAQGTIGCSGGCNVAQYPICNNDGTASGNFISVSLSGSGSLSGGSTLSGGVASAPALEITARPLIVRPGNTSRIIWLSQEMKTCSVSGENGDAWTAVAGQQMSRPITEETTYTLTCTTYLDVTMTDTVIVRVTPTWQEE